MLKSKQFNYNNFAEIADIILNKTVLRVKSKTFRICEIEFYYCGRGHEDNYTHCSDEQKMNCKFYFHKYDTGTYKSGTYKGLDITLSPDGKTYFGILIRSIFDMEKNVFMEGPCRSVNLMLEQFGCKEVAPFVENKKLPLDVYDKQYEFYIDDAVLSHKQIYKGIRIGLSDKFPTFQTLPYRFAIMIENIQKKRNTFAKCT